MPDERDEKIFDSQSHNLSRHESHVHGESAYRKVLTIAG